MARSLFSEDFETEPCWWDAVARPPADAQEPPAAADVVTIGAGYTGLSAALQTARAGRDTVVLDAEAAGWGCSTRNGGQIGTSIKPSLEALAPVRASVSFTAAASGGSASWRMPLKTLRLPARAQNL